MEESLNKNLVGILEQNKIVTKQIDRLDAANRAKNIVITGIAETANDSLQSLIKCVEHLCNKMGLQEVLIDNVFRLGKKSSGATKRPRRIFVKLVRMVDKKSMIMAAKKMRNEKIFINDDLNAAERETGKILRDKFRALKRTEPDIRRLIRGDTMTIWKDKKVIKKYKVVDKVAMLM
ncbi:unnamed protein product [Orchesella dallaii]|uniref:Uncharacterized protein n=1 Tax=Orchesella dallaii TaxID=48710 RepID=A0ABP1RGP0_9HEXA